jgi:hypothetical protein
VINQIIAKYMRIFKINKEVKWSNIVKKVNDINNLNTKGVIFYKHSNQALDHPSMTILSDSLVNLVLK